MKEIKDTTLGLKITKSLKEELERLAAEDNRTLSNYVFMVLIDHVRAVRERLESEKSD